MARCTRTLLTRTVLLAASLGVAVTASAASTVAAAAPGSDASTVAIARESASIASWARSQGLAGLSPASLHPVAVAAPTPRYARDIFANIP